MFKIAALGVALAAVLAAGALVLDTLGLVTHEPSKTISLIGFGFVKAPADTATVTIGVRTAAPTAGGALADNNTAMNALFAAIDALGIDRKAVKTSGFRIQQRFREVPATGRRFPDGFDAVNMVEVRLEDEHSVGAFIDATVGEGGANSVDDISFFIDDSSLLTERARAAAIENAWTQARTYAESAGLRVRRVIQIREPGLDYREPPRRDYSSASPLTTIATPSDLTIADSMIVTFELE